MESSERKSDFVKSIGKVVKANEHPDWEVLQLLQSLRSKKPTDASLFDSESSDTTMLGKDNLLKDGGAASEEPRF